MHCDLVSVNFGYLPRVQMGSFSPRVIPYTWYSDYGLELRTYPYSTSGPGFSTFRLSRPNIPEGFFSPTTNYTSHISLSWKRWVKDFFNKRIEYVYTHTRTCTTYFVLGTSSSYDYHNPSRQHGTSTPLSEPIPFFSGVFTTFFWS